MRPLFACLSLLATTPLLAQGPDLILTNGKILTVDSAFSVQQAMAVTGDRITAVGTNEEIGKLAGANTQKIDLGGKTLMPGLIDSHVHATGAAVHEFDHEIPEMETIADVLAYIRKRAEVLEDGQWINLSQIFITRLREQRFPTRAEMDEAAPKNPVAFRTGPDSVLNSLALQLSGIDRNTEVEPGQSGKIEKDPVTGEPTGILRSAGQFIKSSGGSGKTPTTEEHMDRLAALFADYNKWGITSVSDRNAGDSGIRLYEKLMQEKRLTCRVFIYYSIGAGSSLEDIQKNLDKAANHPLHAYNPWVWVRGAKFFLDGGMLTGSAYMNQPWGVSAAYGIADPKYQGLRYVDPEKVYQIAKYALSKDIQITAHAVGDGAVETLVGAYSRIAKDDFPVREKRPCVTHCNFMSPTAIAQMKEHGIVADLQPIWLHMDGRTLEHQFGAERLTWFQPYKSLFEAGVVVGGGSDHMQKIGSLRSVNPYNPFLGMWTTLTRQPRWSGTPIHTEQIITREQAIRLYTINNAFLSFEEKEKGSLEAGKLADFIVLDRDIMTCPVEEVKVISVEQTFVGGKQVYGQVVGSTLTF